MLASLENKALKATVALVTGISMLVGFSTASGADAAADYALVTDELTGAFSDWKTAALVAITGGVTIGLGIWGLLEVIPTGKKAVRKAKN